MALAQLSIDIVAKLAKFEEDMRQAADATKGFRDRVTSDLDGLKSLVGNFAVGMAGGMAAAFSVGAVRDWINANTEAADELGRLSQQTGVSVESLSAWGNVAKRNGQDVNDLSELIQELSLKLTETDKDTEGAGLALKQLGLNYKELGKLGAEEAFKRVSQAVAGVEDSGKKTAMVMSILGDEGQKYVSTLNTIGSAAELEATITAEQAAAAARYKDSLAGLSAAGEAWSQSVVAGITPALDEAARALTDVIEGTGGMADEARTLSRDGTIADWARNAVTALTYLMDAGALVTRSIKSIGLVIGATMASAGAGIAAVGEAASLAAEGNFGAALDALKSYGRQVKSIDGDLESDLRDTWGQTLGSQIRDRMDQMRAAGVEASKAIDTAKKSSKNFTLVKQDDSAAKKKSEEAKKALEEYAKLVTSIRTKTAADEAEAAGLAPLTDAQRAALEVMTQIRDNRLKLSDEQKRQIVQYLEEAAAASEAAAAARLQAEWLRESGDANAQALEQSAARTDDLRKQIKAEADQVAQWGLSAEALAELQRARQIETAAALESRAAAMAGLESHAALVAQWTEQADAIRELVELQRQQAEQRRTAAEDPYQGAKRGVQGYIDEIRRAGDAAEQFAGKSLRGVEDALTELATTGKADWKSLVSSMIAEAMRMQVIRPMMTGLLGGGGGAGGAAGGVISLLGRLAGGKGGGTDSFNSWEADAGLSSGAGGSWLSSAAGWVGSLFGRANGGPVQPGEMYQVNERGPELLTVGNRTMLMMGHDSGVVSPLQSAAGGTSSGGAAGSSVVVNQTINFGGADAVTREDVRRAAAEAKQAALAEFANFRARGVRGYT